jgi:GNAT superfamily N-acetyltransferase
MHIRPGTIDDTALIFALISELAEFEQLAHEVTADAATLQQHLFGPNPRAEVLIAEVAGESAGFALFFHNFSTFLGKPGVYLEDLYVRPAFRGHGVGRGLMVRLAQLALERGCGRFEWWVLDWNRRAIEFYASLGAQPMSEWTVQRVTGAALEALAKSGTMPT